MAVYRDLVDYQIAYENNAAGTRNVRGRLLARFNNGLDVASTASRVFTEKFSIQPDGRVVSMDYYVKDAEHQYTISLMHMVSGGQDTPWIKVHKTSGTTGLDQFADAILPRVDSNSKHIRYTHVFFVPLPDYDSDNTNYYIVAIGNKLNSRLDANTYSKQLGAYILVYRIDFDELPVSELTLVTTLDSSSFENKYFSQKRIERAFLDEFTGNIILSNPSNTSYFSSSQILSISNAGSTNIKQFNTRYIYKFAANADYVATLESSNENYADVGLTGAKRVLFYKRDDSETGYIMYRLYDYRATNSFPGDGGMLDISWLTSSSRVIDISLSAKNYFTVTARHNPTSPIRSFIYVVNLWDFTSSYQIDLLGDISKNRTAYNAYYDETADVIYYTFPTDSTLLQTTIRGIDPTTKAVLSTTPVTNATYRRSPGGMIHRRGALIHPDASDTAIYKTVVGGVASIKVSEPVLIRPSLSTTQYSDVHGYLLKAAFDSVQYVSAQASDVFVSYRTSDTLRNMNVASWGNYESVTLAKNKIFGDDLNTQLVQIRVKGLHYSNSLRLNFYNDISDDLISMDVGNEKDADTGEFTAADGNATLLNVERKYTPRNPNSPFFGFLKGNVEVVADIAFRRDNYASMGNSLLNFEPESYNYEFHRQLTGVMDSFSINPADKTVTIKFFDNADKLINYTNWDSVVYENWTPIELAEEFATIGGLEFDSENSAQRQLTQFQETVGAYNINAVQFVDGATTHTWADTMPEDLATYITGYGVHECTFNASTLEYDVATQLGSFQQGIKKLNFGNNLARAYYDGEYLWTLEADPFYPGNGPAAQLNGTPERAIAQEELRSYAENLADIKLGSRDFKIPLYDAFNAGRWPRRPSLTCLLVKRNSTGEPLLDDNNAAIVYRVYTGNALNGLDDTLTMLNTPPSSSGIWRNRDSKHIMVAGKHGYGIPDAFFVHNDVLYFAAHYRYTKAALVCPVSGSPFPALSYADRTGICLGASYQLGIERTPPQATDVYQSSLDVLAGAYKERASVRAVPLNSAYKISDMLLYQFDTSADQSGLNYSYGDVYFPILDQCFLRMDDGWNPSEGYSWTDPEGSGVNVIYYYDSGVPLSDGNIVARPSLNSNQFYFRRTASSTPNGDNASGIEIMDMKPYVDTDGATKILLSVYGHKYRYSSATGFFSKAASWRGLRVVDDGGKIMQRLLPRVVQEKPDDLQRKTRRVATRASYDWIFGRDYSTEILNQFGVQFGWYTGTIDGKIVYRSPFTYSKQGRLVETYDTMKMFSRYESYYNGDFTLNIDHDFNVVLTSTHTESAYKCNGNGAPSMPSMCTIADEFTNSGILCTSTSSTGTPSFYIIMAQDHLGRNLETNPSTTTYLAPRVFYVSYNKTTKAWSSSYRFTINFCYPPAAVNYYDVDLLPMNFVSSLLSIQGKLFIMNIGAPSRFSYYTSTSAQGSYSAGLSTSVIVATYDSGRILKVKTNGDINWGLDESGNVISVEDADLGRGGFYTIFNQYYETDYGRIVDVNHSTDNKYMNYGSLTLYSLSNGVLTEISDTGYTISGDFKDCTNYTVNLRTGQIFLKAMVLRNLAITADYDYLLSARFASWENVSLWDACREVSQMGDFIVQITPYGKLRFNERVNENIVVFGADNASRALRLANGDPCGEIIESLLVVEDFSRDTTYTINVDFTIDYNTLTGITTITHIGAGSIDPERPLIVRFYPVGTHYFAYDNQMKSMSYQWGKDALINHVIIEGETKRPATSPATKVTYYQITQSEQVFTDIGGDGSTPTRVNNLHDMYSSVVRLNSINSSYWDRTLNNGNGGYVDLTETADWILEFDNTFLGEDTSWYNIDSISKNRQNIKVKCEVFAIDQYGKLDYTTPAGIGWQTPTVEGSHAMLYKTDIYGNYILDNYGKRQFLGQNKCDILDVTLYANKMEIFAKNYTVNDQFVIKVTVIGYPINRVTKIYTSHKDLDSIDAYGDKAKEFSVRLLDNEYVANWLTRKHVGYSREECPRLSGEFSIEPYVAVEDLVVVREPESSLKNDYCEITQWRTHIGYDSGSTSMTWRMVEPGLTLDVTKDVNYDSVYYTTARTYSNLVDTMPEEN